MLSLLENPLLRLYLNLIGWTLLGFFLGRKLPRTVSSYLGVYLFWIGVPISIIAFMRRANLSGTILIAPLTAWLAIIIGAVFAWIWIELGLSDERIKMLSAGLVDEDRHHQNKSLPESNWNKPTQGSFLLAMMVGNTAYLGYPVALSVVGPEYFLWSVLYNTLGTAIGVYAVGTTLAAHFGTTNQRQKSLMAVVVKNPALWSLGFGFVVRNVPLPSLAESSLRGAAWTVVTLSLIMIGMQLSQLPLLHKLRQASTCLIIKMLLVPLVVGTGLMFFRVTGLPRLAIVLQMAMPPSFNTVVLAQAYGLDRDLSVTTVAFGALGLLLTLPIWIWLFGY